jgi:hypothetical protein
MVDEKTVMQLRLPRNQVRSFEEVVTTISNYRKDCPAVIDLFDRTIDGPHDDITPVDVLSLHALEAFGGRVHPMTPLTSLWLERDNITDSVCPVTKRDIDEITDEEVDSEVPKVAHALRVIDGIKGFGSTSSAKLLHRLRPNVGAIWDSHVQQWYERKKPRRPSWVDWLRTVYSQVRQDDNRRCLLAVRESLDVCLPLLRIWDIVLWQSKPPQRALV